jgi:hypothetical protein
MLSQLPPGGAVIVVPNQATADWIYGQIQQIARTAPLTPYRYNIVPVRSMVDVDRLRGRSTPIFIEHSWWDFAVKAKVVAALMEQVQITNSRFPDARAN